MFDFSIDAVYLTFCACALGSPQLVIMSVRSRLKQCIPTLFVTKFSLINAFSCKRGLQLLHVEIGYEHTDAPRMCTCR
jgi:hypothetical protein